MGKKIKGRKRHISVDTLGNLSYVKVHAANQSDTKEWRAVFELTARKYPSLRAFPLTKDSVVPRQSLSKRYWD